MARVAKEVKSNIEFGEWTPTEAVNPYLDDVKDLAERSKENANASLIVTVPWDDAKSTKFKVQKAANEIGRTAKLRHTDTTNVVFTKEDGEDVGTGDVRLIFTLGERHKSRNRKANKDAAPEAAQEAAE